MRVTASSGGGTSWSSPYKLSEHRARQHCAHRVQQPCVHRIRQGSCSGSGG
jgi:hypothetical protein